MADINEFFPSKYLKAGDLATGPRLATMDRVEQVTFQDEAGGQVKKPALYFQEEGFAPVVLNRKNAAAIA